MAAGAVLLFLAVGDAGEVLRGAGRRLHRLAAERLAKTSGRLARENTMRNPARTAATAAALMIGLGVVVFVAVFAQGLKSSFIDSFDEVVRADYVVAGKNYLTIPSDTVTRLQGLPAVDAPPASTRQAVQVDGNGHARSRCTRSTLPPSARVWSFDWLAGTTRSSVCSAPTGLVEEQTAETLAPGRATSSTTLTQGRSATLKVLGEYRDPMMLNGVTVDNDGLR